MTVLGEYLVALGQRRREWGVHDCATLPCDWAVLRGHPDPMAEWRGTYTTDDDARAMIASEGGLLSYFERAFANFPVREGAPQPGDVGVIQIAGLEAGAIFTGERWAFVGDRGIAMSKVNASHIAKVWIIGHG